MGNILETIIATKREEMKAAKAILPYEEILREAVACDRPVRSFRRALEESPTGIIAEFKRKSPSKGFIKEGARVADIVSGYERSGAAAVSVLTDRDYFSGSLEDLREARDLVDLPLLRKDFIIDKYQVCEARLAGADVILLIAANLTPEETYELAEFARRLGLEVLLEIHNREEAIHINEFVDVVGVNNRNLTTFVTEVRTSFDLIDAIPGECVRISESGISDPDTVRQLRAAGFRGFLMGENFMKQPDPAAALKEFTEAL